MNLCHGFSVVSILENVNFPCHFLSLLLGLDSYSFLNFDTLRKKNVSDPRKILNTDGVLCLFIDTQTIICRLTFYYSESIQNSMFASIKEFADKASLKVIKVLFSTSLESPLHHLDIECFKGLAIILYDKQISEMPKVKSCILDT